MIVITDPDPRFAKSVARVMTGVSVTHVRSLAQIDEHVTAELDVLLIGPGVDVNDALETAQQLQHDVPEVSVVLVADGLSTDMLQSALRAGVRDILPVEADPAKIAETLERARSLSKQFRERSTPPPEPSRASRCDVITVFSSKGGVGKSFVAANLAVTLAKSGASVALIDLDLQFGDLAIMLQLFPARTMYDAAQNLANLDVEAMNAYLARHPSNVHLLAAPFEPGLAETIPADAVTQILALLRQSFRYVVIDSPAAFTDHIVAALGDSDSIALLTSLDVPSIKNLKLAMQTLELLGIKRERIKLVLNRADSEVGLRVQDVEKTLATTVDVTIPSGREVPLSINRGVPLVSEVQFSPVVMALQKLAGLVANGDSAPATSEARPKRKSLLRRRVG